MARERSRAYPAYSLKDAVEWASAVQKNIGRGVFDREMAGSSFGSAGGSGTVPRKVASMVQFGILDLQKGGGYQLSSLGMRIVMPCSELERKEAILEAFGNPPLYRELLARFRKEGSIPVQLPNILVREFRIAAPAAHSAARVFLQSGRCAGILGEDGDIIGDAGPMPDDNTSATSDVDEASEALCSEVEPSPGVDNHSGPAKAVSANDMALGQQVQELRLSKGTARLCVPAELSVRDIKLLQKMLEVWALQVELLQSSDESLSA